MFLLIDIRSDFSVQIIYLLLQAPVHNEHKENIHPYLLYREILSIIHYIMFICIVSFNQICQREAPSSLKR
jgi:hypothetical protein